MIYEFLKLGLGVAAIALLVFIIFYFAG